MAISFVNYLKKETTNFKRSLYLRFTSTWPLSRTICKYLQVEKFIWKL